MIGLVLHASEFEDCSNLGSQESGFQPHGHASQVAVLADRGLVVESQPHVQQPLAATLNINPTAPGVVAPVNHANLPGFTSTVPAADGEECTHAVPDAATHKQYT